MKRVASIVVLSLPLLGAPGAFAQGQAQAPPKAGPAQVAAPNLALVRSVSGTQVREDGGRKLIDDPRSIFYVPDDMLLTVYFEWDGAPGKHSFEGLWKDPSGRVVVVSAFDYEATTKRFGAFWQFNLTEHMQTGWWSLEARVDGEYGGTHSFEIIARPRPELSTRRVLTTDEVYRLASEASVFIEKLDREGQRIGMASGFRLAPQGIVVTAFHAIDGAAGLRVGSAGREVPVDSVLAWDRRRDFALLKLPDSDAAGALPAAAPDSWKVGDRVFALDVPDEGNRVVVEGNITGRHTFPEFGERLNVSLVVRQEGSGGLVLNEYGEVVALLQAQGGLLPGSWSLTRQYGYLRSLPPLLQTRTVALPLSQLPNPLPEAPTSLTGLYQQGQFIPPLVGEENVMMATLAKDLQKADPIPQPIDERAEYRRSEEYMQVLVGWQPKRKGKHLVTLRVFDLDNRPLLTTKPNKISFSPNDTKYTSWRITLGQSPPGFYRIDVLLDDTPIWRMFFRIVE